MMNKILIIIFIPFILSTLFCQAEEENIQNVLDGDRPHYTDLSVNRGDIFYIALPGETDLNKKFQVDEAGLILLPEIGELPVEGLSEKQALMMIRQALNSVYRDDGRLEVSLQQRRLLIKVLGYVVNPGTVNLPNDADIQMAIDAAGGLKSGAQMDKLQLKREKKISHFNYKGYLDTGDADLLPELVSMDTIFVPASPLTGNVKSEFDIKSLASGGDSKEDKIAIKVFGEVRQPGLYSYKESANVLDFIMRAGGVTRFAGVEKIRVINEGQPEAFNLKHYLDGLSTVLPPLNKGATIYVPILAKDIKVGKHMVYVMGEVAKPGAFENQPGSTFMDVLANAGGPTRFAETRQIRLLRANGEILRFDLQAYTEQSDKQGLPEIIAGDAIFIPEKTATNENSWLKVPPQRAIYVVGAVGRPGRYEWSNEMTLFDLLAHAGGPDAKADIAHIQVLKRFADGRMETEIFDLASFTEKGGEMSSVPKLKAGYTLMIPELPQDPSDNKAQWIRQASDNSIYIMGQVNAPGRYRFNTEMDFLDILAAADGPGINADLHNVRITHRNKSTARVTKLNLSLYFKTGDESLLPNVVPGDTIFIPEKEGNWLDEDKQDTVRVLGAVGKPGRYRFNDDMTLLDILAEAGGPTEAAYVERIVVVNTSCCKDQSTTFDLVDFVKQPNFSKLPLLREGDTVYIPDMQRSNWRIFMDTVRDSLSIITLYALGAAVL